MVHILLQTTTADWCDVGQITVDMFPDMALLEIFDFYVADPLIYNRETWNRGSRSCTSVENGERSSLGHHVSRISDLWKKSLEVDADSQLEEKKTEFTRAVLHVHVLKGDYCQSRGLL
jgi:hypothetical protein